MAALSDLQEKLKKALLPDVSAFNTMDAAYYLNEGQERIAAGIAMHEGVLSPPLPELYKTVEVSTVIIADATTIAFVDSDPDTITDSGNAFLTSGFAAGMPIIVSGAGESENNGTFHSIATVVAGTITLVSTDALTAEAASEEVTIKSPCLSLPSDYGRGLSFVASESQNKRIQVYSSFHKFLRKYPLLNETGSVVSVAVKGNFLYHQSMPSSDETLILHYYRVPTAMSEAKSTPDGIPAHLQERLLVNYAAKEIYSMVEDAVKGKTPKQDKYEEKFQKAMVDLVAFIGPEDTEPGYYDDDSGYEDGYY